MPALEKQQIISFLKILQIPTDQTAEEIKRSLLEAGWNEKDADEALTVLRPHQQDDTAVAKEGSKEEQTEPAPNRSQIIAQKYVQHAPPPPIPAPTPEKTAFTPRRVESTAEEQVVVDAAKTIAAERAARTQETEQDSTDRPHTDAPWLEHQVDIYDVTPEEREEMIRTVYRTNEKLSPQTIHALLGIDVDLSELEQNYRDQYHSTSLTWTQIAIIIILSVALAVLGFVFGMYYFEVGPFHPSLNNS